MEYVATTHGNYQFEFPRITIILGANGSGKSTLLKGIKDHFRSVYVEGGRTITIADVVELDRNNFNQYRNLGQTLAQYKGKRRSKLVDRIFDAIISLIQKEQSIKDAHSDQVVKWEEDGRPGDPPKREQPPLQMLFEQYNEVFPHLHLSFNKENGQVTVVNDNAPLPYGPSGLSDGEKQVFSLMADMLQLEDEYDLIVVDEPELNLHPELAERLWNLLESEYQDKSFLYATHSIQFALRSQVDALYVLSSDPGKIRKIENLLDMPRNELERFLGGVPGILNAGKVVVTEGHEKSFDSIFYRWLLSDSKVEIFPCGSCSDVQQVISKQGLWSQVSSDIRLIGAIDSDFRTAESLAAVVGEHLIPLALHEAESYICLPEVIVAAAAGIGSQDKLPTVEDVAMIIFDELRANRLPVALRRTFSEAAFTVRMSLERSILSAVATKEEAMNHIRSRAAEEVSKAVVAMSESAFEDRLDQELAAIDKALAEEDILQALRLVPGKQLLAKLAPRTGCKNGTDLMRSINRNLMVESFKPVKQIADRLKKSIIQQDGPCNLATPAV